MIQGLEYKFMNDKSLALFIPCYMDQVYPSAALALTKFLSRRGMTFHIPEHATCCAQPMANSGDAAAVRPVARKWANDFKGSQKIVCPSGSCTSMIRNHFKEYFKDGEQVLELAASTQELSEFLLENPDLLKDLPPFPHKVVLHYGCHGLRELNSGPASENRSDAPSLLDEVLDRVPDIKILPSERPDECCGFGGTFALFEADVSGRMGEDRVKHFVDSGAEYIISQDASCLLQMKGIIEKKGYDIKILHLAEVLNGDYA